MGPKTDSMFLCASDGTAYIDNVSLRFYKNNSLYVLQNTLITITVFCEPLQLLVFDWSPLPETHRLQRQLAWQ